MINVTYDSNNSGGSWWLTDEDWYALEKAGWNVEWKKDSTSKFSRPDSDGRWLGALATKASKDFGSMREAVSEWESVTGQRAADEGCHCCGPPHNFSGKDEDGKHVSGPTIEVETHLSW
jgi:hypothetical protein